MTQTKTRRPRRTYSDEFKNQIIDEILDTFNIERSLSMKGSPCPSMQIEGILH